MGRLAEYESVSRPSATGIVRRLVDKGLVARSSNPDDLRSAIVEITDEGHALLEQRRRERTAYLANEIERLGPDDLAVLERAVTILERIERSS